MTDGRDCLSPVEAAAFLGCSERTVFSRLRDGSIGSRLQGRSRVIEVAELERFRAATGGAPAVTDGDCLSPGEAAAFLGCSERTLFSRLRDGSIGSRLQGRSRVIEVAELKRFQATGGRPAKSMAWPTVVASDLQCIKLLLQLARADPTDAAATHGRLQAAETLAARAGIVADHASERLARVRIQPDSAWLSLAPSG
ncbi:MAG: helix-turn-helix domain-containing protein [Burkholderiales bacterium]|nr:helix-turn-helix domain-containing protein [Burkholderiales bacterium]